LQEETVANHYGTVASSSRLFVKSRKNRVKNLGRDQTSAVSFALFIDEIRAVAQIMAFRDRN